MNHVAVPKGGPLWESRKLMRLSGSYKNGTVHEDICHHARSRFDFVGASTWQAPTDLFFFYWIQAGRQPQLSVLAAVLRLPLVGT